MSDLTKKQEDVAVSSSESTISKLLKQKVITIKQAADLCWILNDHSGSMAGKKWDELVKANLILGQHSRGTDLVTCTFSDSLTIGVCLDEITSIGGGTRMGAALLETYRQMREKQYKTRRIILVSDGEPTDLSTSQIITDAKTKGEGIIIDTVGIGYDCDKEFLEELAKATGGLFYFCPDGDYSKLSQVLLELSPEVRQIGHSVINL